MFNKKLPLILMLVGLFAQLFIKSEVHADPRIETVVYIDDQPVTTPALIQNNHYLVPALFFRHVGAVVDWNEKYHAAVLALNGRIIGFPSHRNYSDYQLDRNSKWQRSYLNTTTIDMPDATYIPLAFAARMLGMEVYYDKDSKTTHIRVANANATPKATLKQQSSQAGVYWYPALHVPVTEEDLYWFYRIVEAEAGGESYTGKVAVAASILNRVKSDEWPNTIKDTIFQVTTYNGVSYYQYSPVLDKRIYKVTPSQESIQAVHDALKGWDPSKGAIVFYNPAKTNNKWVRSRPVTTVIGNHVFAK